MKVYVWVKEAGEEALTALTCNTYRVCGLVEVTGRKRYR